MKEITVPRSRTIINRLLISYPIIVLIFLIARVFWFVSPWMLYWVGVRTFLITLNCILITGVVPFLVLLFISEIQRAKKILIGLISLFLLCPTGLLGSSYPDYKAVDELEFNNHKYILANAEGSGLLTWSILECSKVGFICSSTWIFADSINSPPENTRFVHNVTGNEVYVVTDSTDPFTFKVKYIIGSHNWEPIPAGGYNTFGYREYYLFMYTMNDTDYFTIYQFDSSTNIKRLPFLFTSSKDEWRGNNYFIEINQTSGEVLFTRNGRKIFSYDDSPHCYVDACSTIEP